MYSHHFGLTQDPFSIAPDPRYLFMSERHREALAHLLYGVAGVAGAASGTGGGFVLLTGDIGTGKTTICRCFLEQIPARCHVAYIFNPKLTVIELLQSVCEEFHITAATDAPNAPGEFCVPTLKNYIDALNAFLLHSHAAGQSSVLIIDEAQNLSADVLEQLRLLTNLETNERKLLQIVLIGQPELRAMLERPELEQLAQRVIARFHLDALTQAESVQYISHRLAVAGHVGALPFEAKALQRIHHRTHGVPRRLNLLCGRALLGAWANGLHRVSAVMVDKAAAEVFGQEANVPSVARRAGRPVVYALLGLAGLAGAVLAGFLWGRNPLSPPLLVAQAAAPVFGPVEEIQALLPQLPSDINAAWRALAPVWKLPVTDADPCQAASLQPFQCYRTASLSVLRLRQLGRPGILTLQAGDGAPVYALLTGLSDHSATLQIANRPHTVRLVALVALWRGDFATFWRPPPGYNPGLRGEGAGLALGYLARQLAQLDGAPPSAIATPPVLDAALRARIEAFQRAQGLEPDGQPGPMTFMQIDNALDASAPRLQTNLR